MKIKFCIVACFTVFNLLNTLTATANENQLKTLLVLGDSLSAAYGINVNDGWVSLLKERLNHSKSSYRIVNASVSGDTTRTALNRLPAALKTHAPDFIIIALGGNDGLRGLPFSEIENSLDVIITQSKKHNAKVLLAGVRMPPNYGIEYAKKFSKIYKTLKDRHKIRLVPQLLKNVAEHSELMQADGMHPKAAAQKIILDNIWVELSKML